SMEDSPLGDCAVEREAELDGLFDRPPVGHGQRAREREAHGARLAVRLATEAIAATAEHLRLRLQLDVDLQPDHGLPRHLRRSGTTSKPIACSRACAAR